MFNIQDKLYTTIVDGLSNNAGIEKIAVIGGVGNTIDRFSIDINDAADINQCALSVDSILTINEWNTDRKLTFWGIVHSHPNGFSRLSQSDVHYALAIITLNRLDNLLMGVVENRVFWLYEISSSGKVHQIPFNVIDQK